MRPIVSTLESCSLAVERLPRPFIHLKGLTSGLNLVGSHEEPREQRNEILAESEALADTVVQSAITARTLIWDGDEYARDSFTALIPRIADESPSMKFVAFVYADEVESF